ncbi:MAG: amidohydrolase family protein [Rhodospirillaceae bacterium]|nr:amidohydrolase family protein [Rhodospirillaceae bacterium]
MTSCSHFAHTAANGYVDPKFHGSCFICAAAEDDDRPVDTRRRTLLRVAAAAPIAALALGQSPRRAEAASQRPPEGAFVVRAGAALLENGAELTVEHGVDILVRGGVIEDIRQGEIAGFPVVDAGRHLVLPSFISGHTHCCSGTPTRGIFEAGRSYRDPLQLVEKLSDEEQDALTALNMAELLRGGCTTHVEMALTLRQAESYVRIAKAWGVRGFPGHMIPNTTRLFDIWFRTDDKVLMDSEPGTLAEIADGLKFGKAHMNAADGLIVPMMTAHATDTHTPATMRALKAACDDLGTGLHIHYSQGSGEPEAVQRAWKMNPTQWLDSFGLLDQPLFGAHMSGIDWATEGPILKAKGVVYSHCPSGGGAGGGSQPYPEALAAGVPTNIGIDTHSNDYLEDLKLAVLYGKNRYRHLRRTSAVPLKSPTVMDALDSATRVAADALKRPDLGRLKVGCQADITTVDVSGLLSGAGAMPPEPIYNLLYCNGMMVRHVMTRGRIQVFDGQLAVADEAKVLADGGRVVRKIWDQLANDGWFSAPIPRRG